MVLSCLSAHAALAVFDGVERTTLPAKCTGVFAQEADPTHPLVAGLYGPVVLPHSRLNTVPVEAVVDAGYAVALQSDEVGWSVVTKTVGRSEVVLVQAHPEYDPSSLVREYARDVRRYAGHEHDELPCLPLGLRDRPGLGQAPPAARAGGAAASGTRPWWPPSPSTRSAPAPPGRGGARPCVCTPTCWAPSRRGAPEAMHDETIAIHGGYTPDGTRAVAVPIYQTVAHDFIDADHAGAVLDLETPGFHYNRLNNPTFDVLEQRICALEGGTAALVVASGMAAVSYAILTVASAGSNFVVAPQLYGATFTYFAHVLPTLGIEARFAVDDRAESIAPLIDENTRAVFCETIGNPAGNIVDLEAVAAVAHAAGVPLIVDNTVATPLMLKPFEHGADVVVHSLTKFVGGHGTTLGGAIVDGGRFPWADHPDRFPMFNQPEPAFHDVVFARDFPERPFTVRARSTQLRNSGATLSPFNAFLLLQGLETMAVRLERHEANARAVADYLAADPRVAWVSFAGFPDHPYHHLVERYLHGRVPSIITFGVDGGYDAGLAFFDALQLVKRLLNLGDAKTLAIHPASTTHRQLSDEELVKAGIRPETIRLSIGIEHIDDIIDDIDQALAKATVGQIAEPTRRGMAFYGEGELMTNAEETLRGPKRDVILYELNEVPWRVVDYYIERRPDSHLPRC